MKPGKRYFLKKIMVASVSSLVKFTLMVHGYSINHGQFPVAHPVPLTLTYSACRDLFDIGTPEQGLSAIPSRSGARGIQHVRGAVFW